MGRRLWLGSEPEELENPARRSNYVAAVEAELHPDHRLRAGALRRSVTPQQRRTFMTLSFVLVWMFGILVGVLLAGG